MPGSPREVVGVPRRAPWSPELWSGGGLLWEDAHPFPALFRGVNGAD